MGTFCVFYAGNYNSSVLVILNRDFDLFDLFGKNMFPHFLWRLTQAQYLLLHPEIDCGVFQVVIIIGVQAIGYYIFRNSNGQKNDFRTIPGSLLCYPSL